MWSETRGSEFRDVLVAGCIGFLIALFSLSIISNLMRAFAAPQVSLAVRTGLAVVWCVVIPLCSAGGFWVVRGIARRVWTRLFQITKYGLVGTLNAFLHAAIVNACIYVSDREQGYLVTGFFIFAFLITVTHSYFWNKHWTFVGQSEHATRVEYTRFFCVTATILSVVTVLFHVLINDVGPLWNMHPRVWVNMVLVLLAILSFLGNYIGYNLLVFTSPATMSAHQLHPNPPQTLFELAKRYHYLVAFVVSVAVGITVVGYTTITPQWIDDDNIDLILSEEAKRDPNYPDREVVAEMGYGMYVWPKLVYYASQTYDLRTFHQVMIGISTALTVYGAYIALFMLGFGPKLSLLVSLVGLLPRYVPADNFGGLLLGVTGRSFAIPVSWLLAAWYLVRVHKQKRVWPVFFVMGLAVYLHPLSFVTLVTVFTVVHAIILVLHKRDVLGTVKELVQTSLAFLLGAAPLFWEIGMRAIRSGATAGDSVITAGAYLAAVRARTPYEFPDVILDWTKHEVVVGLFFVGCAVYVWRLIRQGKIERDSLSFKIVLFGTLVTAVAYVVHIVVPVVQLFLIEQFDMPLVFRSFCRTLKYGWLGLLLVFAVAVREVLTIYGRKAAAVLLVCGLLSSSYVFEVFQYAVGYANPVYEYIPVFLQERTYPDPYEDMALWCDALTSVGVQQGDIIIGEQYILRYFCRVRPYVTREEGYAYQFMGKDEVVSWFERWQRQRALLGGTSSAPLLAYGREVGATAIIVPRESPAGKDFIDAGFPYATHRTFVVVGLTQTASTTTRTSP